MSIGFAFLALMDPAMSEVSRDERRFLTAVRLRCENFDQPMAIDSLAPRLSWLLRGTGTARNRQQAAYQILVASTKSRLTIGKADLWDSGKVETSRQNQVVYGGKSLQSWQTCFWKVRVWEQGVIGPWSASSQWDMGLLNQSDWNAIWLEDGKPKATREADFYENDPAPLFRKPFVIKKSILRARLAVSGLGYFEASINGTKVGDHVLDPGWTRYDKRVGYALYDVSDLLQKGQNCVGIRLGNGWYHPLPLRLFGSFNLQETLPTGRPRTIAHLRIEYRDGSVETVPTDLSWKVSESGMLKNNVYLGEVVDARLEPEGWDRPGYDDARWRAPKPAIGDIGPLSVPSDPPIRVTQKWAAVKVTESSPGVRIYDFGVNFAGVARFSLNLPRGTSLRFRYGELLYPNGTLNPMTSVAGQIKGFKQGSKESVGGPGAPEVAWQEDQYITRGGKETYTPRFTFHGFRYVEITGLPKALPLDSVVALRINSDVQKGGSFECSDSLLNEIQEVCNRTFLSNIFSVQSDCPHRERLGYGGDIVATSEAFIANFDMSGFYQKAVRDWPDSALKDGMFTDTAPYIGIQYCGVVWAMAHPLLIDQLFRFYGDTKIGNEQYEAAKRWLSLIEKKYPNGIVSSGLSDHEGLASSPPEVLVTPMYFASVNLIANQAKRLGNQKDEEYFRKLAAKIQKAYCERFVDSSNGRVADATQTSQSMALWTRIVPDALRSKVLSVLVKDIESHAGHLTTGILGTKFMLEELSRAGEIDLAYKIATQRDFPSWGWMLKNGATTLWEHWEYSDNTFSHNHPMFGSISQWLYNWLGGIQPAEDAEGFDRIQFVPKLPTQLEWVKSSYESARGTIISNWRREKKLLKFEFTVPINTQAKVLLPVRSDQMVTEGKTALSRVSGVSEVRNTPDGVSFVLGSGKFSFTLDPGTIKNGARAKSER